MLTKFRNRLPDVGLVIALFLFILFIPVLLVGIILSGVFPSKEDARFKEDYSSWLSKHEGEEFFCYTSRTNSVTEVEKHIVPALDGSVHVIKLVGKQPQSHLEERFVAHSLYNLKNVGFPNVMKIVNGEMFDLSIHSSAYNIISQGEPAELPTLVRQAFAELKGAVRT